MLVIYTMICAFGLSWFLYDYINHKGDWLGMSVGGAMALFGGFVIIFGLRVLRTIRGQQRES